MNIPGDGGGNWRRNKLVEYIGNFPDEIGPLMRSYFEKHEMNKSDQVWWVLLYSACYCMGTACVLYENLSYKDLTQKQLKKFWKNNKDRLIFQSDRRYIKNMDQFNEIAWEFVTRSGRKPWAYIKRFIRDTPEETYATLYKEVSSWKRYGRFGTVLFLYNLHKLVGVDLDSKEYDWKNGSTTTEALYNADYQDDRADGFKKNPALTAEDKAWLDKQLRLVTKNLKKKYPDKDWTLMGITSDLCSYRKLFKQTRYLGYYVDRQQEELMWLEDSWPEYSQMWTDFWDWRTKFLPVEYLGEANDWVGIQKQRFTAWVDKGEFR